MKALLLGNGLNCNADNSCFFRCESISERFLDKFINSLDLFEKWSGPLSVFDKHQLKTSIKYCSNWNIERVARELLRFIQNCVEPNEFSDTLRIRFLRFFKVIAIFSIFYVDSKKCFPIIPAKYIDAIKRYDRVFSLNYVEKWDKDEACIYLHGKLSQEKLPIIDEQLGLSSIDTSGIIFAPEDIDKIVADSVYPSNTLYPSEDLFPGCEHHDLYKKLSEINTLEVFGVSPDGDDALIQAIASIGNVTIYVFSSCSVDGKIAIEKWEKAFHPNVPIIKDTDTFIM